MNAVVWQFRNEWVCISYLLLNYYYQYLNSLMYKIRDKVSLQVILSVKLLILQLRWFNISIFLYVIKQMMLSLFHLLTTEHCIKHYAFIQWLFFNFSLQQNLRIKVILTLILTISVFIFLSCFCPPMSAASSSYAFYLYINCKKS